MAVERKMPRVQEVILPVLRERLEGVNVYTWIPDVERRQMPMLMLRRLGGLPVDVDLLDRAVLEMTAYGDVDLATTENVLLDARQVLSDMVKRQTVTPAGYLHSYFETMGPTQFDSPFEDTWRAQMLVQLGIRPPRN